MTARDKRGRLNMTYRDRLHMTYEALNTMMHLVDMIYWCGTMDSFSRCAGNFFDHISGTLAAVRAEVLDAIHSEDKKNGGEA